MPCLTESKCANCHAPIDINKGENGVLKCEYCGSVFTVAKKETDSAALDLIRLGNHELDICEFDNAFTSFKRAAQLDNGEPEAFMGMALATHKIQYIRDGVNNCLQPICHEISDKVFSQDKNYLQALKLATPQQRAQYEHSGADIDYIKQEFAKLHASGLDYDCFICVKVTDDETGGRTKDYKTAEDLYYHLRRKGYKPFFSELEIGNRTGADYEALILYALYSSECMIVVCSNENYLQTDWVKNEYTRFLKLVADEEKESDAITIVFNGKPIERLPNRKGKLQGIDISRLDGSDRVVKFVEEHTPEAKQRREQKQSAQAAAEEERKRKIEQQARELEELKHRELEELKRSQEQAQRELEDKLKKLQASSIAATPVAEAAATNNSNVSALIKRAQQFAEMEDYDSAATYYNRILDTDPEYGEAWLGLFLANHKVDSLNKLVDVYAKNINKLKKDINFVNAKRYGSGEVLQCINEFEKAIGDKIEEIRLAKIEAERIAKQQSEEAARHAKQRAEQFAKQKAEEAKIEAERLAKQKAEQEAIKRNFKIVSGTLEKYIGTDSYVVIPQSVSRIADSAFEFCNNVANIIIPQSVSYIGRSAFKGCRYLTSVTLSDGLMSIDKCAFEDCSRLTSIVLPRSLLSIEYNAFKGCSSLTSITISSKLYRIDCSAFKDCSNVTSIIVDEANRHYSSKGNCLIKTENKALVLGCSASILADAGSITSIDYAAFSGCKRLTSITIPNSVTSIGGSAFAACNDLTDVTIPNSVTSILSYAFAHCSNLTNITIPNSVTRIYDSAFSDCSSLTSITIPNSVKDIDKSAFYGCSKLKSLIISDGVVSIGDCAFKYCSSLTSVNIPNSVTSIGEDTFRDCSSLASINIPNSVTSIGYCAFYGCGIENATIPASVAPLVKNNKLNTVVITGGEFLPEKSFSYCNNLTSVTISNSVNGIGSGAFAFCSCLKSVTMPKKLKKYVKMAFDKETIKHIEFTFTK